MKRSPDDVTTRVYQYGFYPDAIPSAIHEQLRLANELWNALVSYERTIEARYDAVWRTIPDMDAAYRQLEALKTRYHSASKADKARIKPELSVQEKVIADLKKVWKPQLTSVFKQFWDAIKVERPQKVTAIRHAYANAGLYYG